MIVPPFKFLLVVPAARVAALRTWVANNIDPAGANWFPRGYSPTGSPPATFYGADFHIDSLADARRWVVMLCGQVTGVSAPTAAQWAGWTRAEQKAFLVTLRDALKAQLSVHIRYASNDAGETPDVSECLAAAGLVPVEV